jgi:hypothetical protein
MTVQNDVPGNGHVITNFIWIVVIYVAIHDEYIDFINSSSGFAFIFETGANFEAALSV